MDQSLESLSYEYIRECLRTNSSYDVSVSKYHEAVKSRQGGRTGRATADGATADGAAADAAAAGGATVDKGAKTMQKSTGKAKANSTMYSLFDMNMVTLYEELLEVFSYNQIVIKNCNFTFSKINKTTYQGRVFVCFVMNGAHVSAPASAPASASSSSSASAAAPASTTSNEHVKIKTEDSNALVTQPDTNPIRRKKSSILHSLKVKGNKVSNVKEVLKDTFDTLIFFMINRYNIKLKINHPYRVKETCSYVIKNEEVYKFLRHDNYFRIDLNKLHYDINDYSFVFKMNITQFSDFFKYIKHIHSCAYLISLLIRIIADKNKIHKYSSQLFFCKRNEECLCNLYMSFVKQNQESFQKIFFNSKLVSMDNIIPSKVSLIEEVKKKIIKRRDLTYPDELFICSFVKSFYTFKVDAAVERKLTAGEDKNGEKQVQGVVDVREANEAVDMGEAVDTSNTNDAVDTSNTNDAVDTANMKNLRDLPFTGKTPPSAHTDRTNDVTHDHILISDATSDEESIKKGDSAKPPCKGIPHTQGEQTYLTYPTKNGEKNETTGKAPDTHLSSSGGNIKGTVSYYSGKGIQVDKKNGENKGVSYLQDPAKKVRWYKMSSSKSGSISKVNNGWHGFIYRNSTRVPFSGAIKGETQVQSGEQLPSASQSQVNTFVSVQNTDQLGKRTRTVDESIVGDQKTGRTVHENVGADSSHNALDGQQFVVINLDDSTCEESSNEVVLDREHRTNEPQADERPTNEPPPTEQPTERVDDDAPITHTEMRQGKKGEEIEKGMAPQSNSHDEGVPPHYGALKRRKTSGELGAETIDTGDVHGRGSVNTPDAAAGLTKDVSYQKKFPQQEKIVYECILGQGRVRQNPNKGHSSRSMSRWTNNRRSAQEALHDKGGWNRSGHDERGEGRHGDKKEEGQKSSTEFYLPPRSSISNNNIGGLCTEQRGTDHKGKYIEVDTRGRKVDTVIGSGMSGRGMVGHTSPNVQAERFPMGGVAVRRRPLTRSMTKRNVVNGGDCQLGEASAPQGSPTQQYHNNYVNKKENYMVNTQDHHSMFNTNELYTEAGKKEMQNIQMIKKINEHFCYLNNSDKMNVIKILCSYRTYLKRIFYYECIKQDYSFEVETCIFYLEYISYNGMDNAVGSCSPGRGSDNPIGRVRSHDDSARRGLGGHHGRRDRRRNDHTMGYAKETLQGEDNTHPHPTFCDQFEQGKKQKLMNKINYYTNKIGALNQIISTYTHITSTYMDQIKKYLELTECIKKFRCSFYYNELDSENEEEMPLGAVPPSRGVLGEVGVVHSGEVGDQVDDLLGGDVWHNGADQTYQDMMDHIHRDMVSQMYSSTANPMSSPPVSPMPSPPVSPMHSPSGSPMHGASLNRMHVASLSPAHGASLSRMHVASVSPMHSPPGSPLHGASLNRMHAASLSPMHGASLSRMHGASLSPLRSVAVNPNAEPECLRSFPEDARAVPAQRFSHQGGQHPSENFLNKNTGDGLTTCRFEPITQGTGIPGHRYINVDKQHRCKSIIKTPFITSYGREVSKPEENENVVVERTLGLVQEEGKDNARQVVHANLHSHPTNRSVLSSTSKWNKGTLEGDYPGTTTVPRGNYNLRNGKRDYQNMRGVTRFNTGAQLCHSPFYN
ncbi:hypothetical protein AK88_00369 [Plasmodium fragile]|uniref:Uncharacterized protein n=1 Tax=Plasmodium fragile TaxID=5857 RepID=A0A0D9QSI6_PLAFR|nr:uncharacterized protein AK88_00369 [Plasmodium fragile]KJP89913.1 hypothetical protein AK88_00369 [Plasmodium fragile]